MARGKADAWSGSFRRARIATESTMTMTLGDLRNLVAKCSEMKDGALVRAESMASTDTAGVYYVRVLRVEEEEVNSYDRG